MTSRERALSIIIVALAIAGMTISLYSYRVGYFAAKEIWHDAKCSV